MEERFRIVFENYNLADPDKERLMQDGFEIAQRKASLFDDSVLLVFEEMVKEESQKWFEALPPKKQLRFIATQQKVLLKQCRSQLKNLLRLLR